MTLSKSLMILASSLILLGVVLLLTWPAFGEWLRASYGFYFFPFVTAYLGGLAGTVSRQGVTSTSTKSLALGLAVTLLCWALGRPLFGAVTALLVVMALWLQARKNEDAGNSPPASS